MFDSHMCQRDKNKKAKLSQMKNNGEDGRKLEGREGREFKQ